MYCTVEELRKLRKAHEYLRHTSEALLTSIRRFSAWHRALVQPRYFDLTFEKIIDGYDIVPSHEERSPLVITLINLTRRSNERNETPRIHVSVMQQNLSLIARVRETLHYIDPRRAFIGEVKERLEDFFDEKFARSIHNRC